MELIIDTFRLPRFDLEDFISFGQGAITRAMLSLQPTGVNLGPILGAEFDAVSGKKGGR
jgi:hypothetical protein